MKKIISILFLLPFSSFAQDTISPAEKVYDRQLHQVGNTSTAIGGYVEGNTNYFVTDGIKEGFSMELRRFNIFLYSPVGNRIKFFSELEFEHGTEEIKLETAQLDFNINQQLNLRAGIILAPLGTFNQNHDSPKWDFVERPLSSEFIIPSTHSETGFGIHGKFFPGNTTVFYEVYAVNGLASGIIFNEQGKTFIPAGKSEKMFAEDNNGTPSFTGKTGVRIPGAGEFGISGYSGYYNSFRKEGEQIEPRRAVKIWALDYSNQLGKLKFSGEASFAQIEIPMYAGEFYGEKQWGAWIESAFVVITRKLAGFGDTKLIAALRAEQIDFNLGNFKETGQKKGDEIKALSASLCLRPGDQTAIKVNYRYHWTKDLIGNPYSKTAGIQVGIATYF